MDSIQGKIFEYGNILRTKTKQLVDIDIIYRLIELEVDIAIIYSYLHPSFWQAMHVKMAYADTRLRFYLDGGFKPSTFFL
jgi:hypothetical protein